MIECQNDDCEGVVTEQFARVFGNNHDEVYGCFACMTATDVKRGAARAP